MLAIEQEAHQRTRGELSRVLSNKRDLVKGIYWECDKKAKYIATACSLLYGLFLISGVGLGLRLIPEYILPAGIAIGIVVATLLNVMWGTTVHSAYFWLKNFILNCLLKRKADELKIETTEFEIIDQVPPNE